MPYRYLENIATADVAFEAWGATLEELFSAAADATLNVMVEEPATISCEVTIPIDLENNALDLLLYDFLTEIIFLKDSRQLLLRPRAISLSEEDGTWELSLDLCGARIDPALHRLNVDVKAVTLHHFNLVQLGDNSWQATVVLDI